RPAGERVHLGLLQRHSSRQRTELAIARRTLVLVPGEVSAPRVGRDYRFASEATSMCVTKVVLRFAVNKCRDCALRRSLVEGRTPVEAPMPEQEGYLRVVSYPTPCSDNRGRSHAARQNRLYFLPARSLF